MSAKKAKAESSKKKNDVEFKYTVDSLADDLDITPQSVRVALRKHGVAKAGKQYGWNSDKEYKLVLKLLRDTAPPQKSAA